MLYDDQALEEAWQFTKTWTTSERQELRNTVPRLALETPFRDTNVATVALRILNIAKGGLRRRARVNKKGQDETIYLEPLYELIHDKKTVADEILEKFNGSWGGSIDKIFEEFAF